jgi:hypothetical protein
VLDHSCQVQRHLHADRGVDLYETPAVAVEALLRVHLLPGGMIWEPACGRGAIANVLRAHSHTVVCTDLIDYGIDPTARYGVDFLEMTELPAGVTAVVTNPPYMLANEFVARALQLCPHVVMLLRLAFLESERRSPILDDAGLKRVFVFRKRLPMMHRDGWEGRKANSGMAFAWMFWERGYRGHPITRRISWEDARDAPVLLAQGRPVNGSQSRSHSLKRGANRAYVLARLRRDGRADLVEQVETGALSVRRALALIATPRLAPGVAKPGYDAPDDVTKKFEAAYEAIRQRKARGGPGWVPK